jgi:hypothetical protein
MNFDIEEQSKNLSRDGFGSEIKKNDGNNGRRDNDIMVNSQ